MVDWQNRMPKWRNPPTEKQKQQHFGKNLINDYVDLFNRKVKRQPHFAELTLHVIVGQLPEVRKMRIVFGDNELDLRISGCFFKPSGSGGGRGFNFTAKMSRAVGLVYRTVTEITDAALIGTTDTVKAYDPSKKGMVSTTVIERGALDPTYDEEDKDRPIANIVAMNEADILFSGVMNEHKKSAMAYYQIALNTMNTEDNLLAKKLSRGVWIDFNPECSLFFMSYPPDSFYETVVKKGFLQRMIILYNVFTTEDRIKVARELTKALTQKPTKPAVYEDVIKRLAYVNEYWEGKGKTEFKIDPKAHKILDRLIDEIFSPFRGISEYPRRKLEEFTQRWIEHTWRLAWHHAILRLDDTIKLEDVGYAKNYIIPIWKELIGILEEGIKTPKDHYSAWKIQVTEAVRLYQSIVKQDKTKKSKDPIKRADFVKKLAHTDYWGVSPKTSSQRIKKMEEEGLFERSYIGTAPMIKLKKLPKHLKSSKK